MTDLLTACPWLFLVPLLAGLAFNSASAFTAAYSRRWGAAAGRAVTVVLRNLLGIPLWVAGLVLAARTPAPALLPADTAVEGAAGILIALGTALVIWSLATLRWKAAAPSASDALVDGGPLRPGAPPALRWRADPAHGIVPADTPLAGAPGLRAGRGLDPGAGAAGGAGPAGEGAGVPGVHGAGATVSCRGWHALG